MMSYEIVINLNIFSTLIKDIIVGYLFNIPIVIVDELTNGLSDAHVANVAKQVERPRALYSISVLDECQKICFECLSM